MGATEAKQAATKAYEVARNFHTRLVAIRSFQDPDLTADGLHNRREAMRASAKVSAVTKTTAFAAAARAGAEFALKELAAYRPSLDPSDVAQLTRTAQAWDVIVQPALMAGKSLHQVAQRADMDTLLAIQRFGPATLERDATAIRPDARDSQVAVELATLERVADQRLLTIHPDPAFRERFEQSTEATAHARIAERLAADIVYAHNPSQAAEVLGMANRPLHELGSLPQRAAPSGPEMDESLQRYRAGGGANDLFDTAVAVD